MNDADFEMLAKDALGDLIRHGVKPYTLPTDCWLRLRALELAVQMSATGVSDQHGKPMGTIASAKEFFQFIKGDASEPNLRGQDER